MKSILFVLSLAILAPAASAQQQPQQPTQQRASSAQRFSELQERAAQNNFKAGVRADHQGWLDSMSTLDTLHTKLAEAWQTMGMSPAAAKLVADAYDPDLASTSHHTPLRGKSEQQVALLIQDALRANNYLKANQLLIDFQRQQLALNELSAPHTREGL